jgi:hypothetical protein
MAGFIWGRYVSDDGNTYALRVDADYHAMVERGWDVPADSATIVYPRGWRPRYALGLDAAGHPRRAVVASVVASLWVGSVTTFTIRASDGSLVPCSVVELRQERRAARPS